MSQIRRTKVQILCNRLQDRRIIAYRIFHKFFYLFEWPIFRWKSNDCSMTSSDIRDKHQVEKQLCESA